LRGPWKFLIKALPGGFSGSGLQLIMAWVAFQALAPLSWAAHLRSKVGNSAIADNWGQTLPADDIWELMANGNLQDATLGFWTVAVATLAVLWALWAGWKMQTKFVGLKSGIVPWLAAAPVAFVIGYLPLWMLHASLWNISAFLASLGIPSLGWINLVAGPLLHLAFGSALMFQWWLCRLDLAYSLPKDKKGWLMHIKDSFLRLWLHPIQWGSIVFFGPAIRAGLVFLVLCLAWEWGGQELYNVWLLFFLQIDAAAVNAWIIGWALRVAALYWRNDQQVRSEVRALELAMRQRPVARG
jgi:hypothetical protein